MNIKKLIVGLLSFAVILTSLASVVGPMILPISSPDVARNAALKKVVHGSRAVTSKSINWDYPGSITYTNVVGRNAEEVLTKLLAAELRYEVINPDDEIVGHVWLNDSEDNSLFYGQATYTEADLKAKSVVYNVWIQALSLLDDVVSAEVLVVDEDGVTVRKIEVDVSSGGQILWRPWISGAPNGILVVRFNNGTLLRYDLPVPIAEFPNELKDSAAFAIDGHYIYTNASPTFKIIELWNRPTAYIVTGERDVNIDVAGISNDDGRNIIERPFSMILTNEDDGTVKTEPLLLDGVTRVRFKSGRWRAHFHWQKFGQPNALYAGPEDGYGKGSVEGAEAALE